MPDEKKVSSRPLNGAAAESHPLMDHALALKRILVIGTGGTISETGRNQATRFTAEELLVRFVDRKKFPVLVSKDPFRLDSTNMEPEHWERICNEVAKFIHEFDGVLILHGTDSMAWTVGAIALAFGQGLGIPIAVTGAQIPPYRTRTTDAGANLNFALGILTEAIKADIAEVFIAFGQCVVRGVRAYKRRGRRLNAFNSPGYRLLVGKDGKFREWVRRRSEKVEGWKTSTNFAPGVVFVKISPQTTEKTLRRTISSGEVRGVVIEALGVGNIPERLWVVLEELQERNIPVVVVTSFDGEKPNLLAYPEGREAMKRGAISGQYLTRIMAEVKLSWLIAQGKSTTDVRKDIITDLVGENRSPRR